jgi:hypothetical protein
LPISGAYSLIHQLCSEPGSNVRTTTRRLATRRISTIPASGSRQWWTEKTVIAASTDSSSSGRLSAAALSTSAAPGGRWAIISPEGSSATTSMSVGSYDPVPAPTLTTLRALPRASLKRRSSLGSGRRIAE